MSEELKTVFISYRRDVASFIARAVFMDLCEHGYDTFMDVESIDSGQFDTVILNQIEARAHFVLILTPGTVERCAEPGDWLRREIEYAMDKQRNIVPLLVNNFSFKGTDSFLTGKLTALSRFNGPTVPTDYFEEAMGRLRTRFLKQPVYGVIKPTPAADQAEVERKLEQVTAQPAVTASQLNAEDYFNRAYQEYNNGDIDGAIADYTEAIRINSGYVDAYYNRGLAHKDNGEVDEAIADYGEAIRLSPGYAQAFNNRGIALKTKGDVDGAIADYTRSIELDNPELHFPYNNRANALKAKGDLDGAIADYTEAIRLSPTYVEAFNNRGIALKDKGDLDGSEADFDTALSLNAQYTDAYINRGVTREAKQDYEGAIADYNQALRLNPLYALAYKDRGNALYYKGDLKRALPDYHKYLDLGGGKQYDDQVEVEQWIKTLEDKLDS